MHEIKHDYYSISLPHITADKSVFLPITAPDMKATISPPKNVISALFQGRVNQPNMSYIHPKLGSINYQAVELFISKGQHIYPQDKNHDAELIILHKPTTNAPKLYSCFLLKTKGVSSSMVDTDIDAIIKQTHTPSLYHQELTLCMNNYITKSSPKMDIYEKYSEDGSPCIVVIFKEIINISTAIKEENESLFENFQEAITDNIKDDYLECEFLPGGVDSEDVKVYEIPIGSQVYTDGTSSDWISMLAKNIVVFMGAFIAFFIYPQIYNFFKKKMDDSPNSSWLSETKWADVFIFKNIGSWYNLILTIIFLIISIILISIGITFLSYSFVLSGLFIIFSYIFGYMGIGYLNSQTYLSVRT